VSLLTTIAIAQGFATVLWLATAQGTFEVEYYLYLIQDWRWLLIFGVYACVGSNFVEHLVMIGRRRSWADLFHLPVGIWYGWSVLPAYVQGNVKGLLGAPAAWFRTPKYRRQDTSVFSRLPTMTRTVNLTIFLAVVSFYFYEGWQFGWRDPFALLLVPAFLLAVTE